MDFKKVAFCLFVCVTIVSLYILRSYKNGDKNKKDTLFTIGVLQTASHPALDAVRQGFIDEIRSQVGDKVNFIIQNGQGSISTIHTIAHQFHAKHEIDGIFAIATPAAQAIIAIEKEKPIAVAAVSVSPITSTLFSEKNIYGVSDMIDVRAEIEALYALLPYSKTVGILFSTAEINSVATVEQMSKEIERIGLTPVLIGVTSEIDIEPALMSALRKIDVLLAPTDNVVANSIAMIVDLVEKAGKPLVVSDNMLVEYGALMARGVDYYQSGRQAGALALQVFVSGKKPHDFSIINVDNKEIFINKKICDSLDIIIPESIKADVVLV